MNFKNVICAGMIAVAGLSFAGHREPDVPKALKRAHLVDKILRVGDPAPAFKIGRWLKGSPVQALEKGKYYVVEFWGTWCQPCRMYIPHLTEVAKKFQDKVTVIGVDVWEEGQPGIADADLDKIVDQFVKEMGDKMDYHVCRDTADEYMTKHWLIASAPLGVPHSLIVDPEGKIAWIGHPMRLDKYLPQILDGTFDRQKYAKTYGEKQDQQLPRLEETLATAKRSRDLEQSLKEVEDLIKAKEYRKALTECEHLKGQYTDLVSLIEVPYMTALLKVDQDKAYEYMKTNNVPPNPFLHALAIRDEDGLPRRFYEYAIEVLEPLYRQNNANVDAARGLASAYFNLGNKASAIALQEKAVGVLKVMNASEKDIRECEERLELYRSSKPCTCRVPGRETAQPEAAFGRTRGTTGHPNSRFVSIEKVEKGLTLGKLAGIISSCR